MSGPSHLFQVVVVLILSLLLFLGQCQEEEEEDPILKQLSSLSTQADRIDLLRNLAYTDLQLFKSLISIRKTIPNEDPKAKNLDKYIQDFREGKGGATGWSRKTAVNIAKNPISAYRLVRRYANDLFSEFFVDLDQFPDLPKNAILPQNKYPGEIDLFIVIGGILMNQDFYNLTAADLSRGNVNGIETGAKLDARHCLEIGEQALEMGYFTQGIEWMELAAEKSKYDDAAKLYHYIYSALKDAKNQHDDLFDLVPRAHLYFFTKKLRELEGQERRTRRQKFYEESKVKGAPVNFDMNLYDVCNGKSLQTERQKSRLFCWYEHQKHPKFRIGPLKMEFLAHEPDVVQVYDIIGDKAIKKLKALALVEKDLKKDIYTIHEARLGVNFEKKGFGVYTAVWDGIPRNPAKSDPKTPADFDDLTGTPNSPDLLSIPRNVEAITGLTVTKSDNCSRALFIKPYNFAVSGFPHIDSPIIASAIFYLVDTEGGGFTAFPLVGIAVRPIKGSLVFWFSEVRNGTSDKQTKHVACPVYMGHKVIATKWVLPREQFLHFKCSPQRDERFKILVNGKTVY